MFIVADLVSLILSTCNISIYCSQTFVYWCCLLRTFATRSDPDQAGWNLRPADLPRNCLTLQCYSWENLYWKGWIWKKNSRRHKSLLNYPLGKQLCKPSQYIISDHYRPTSETPFQWRFAGGPMVARFKVLTWFSCANLESFVIEGPNLMIF